VKLFDLKIGARVAVVRSLAGRSADTAKEIKALINASGDAWSTARHW
jgi:hypothetical protein